MFCRPTPKFGASRPRSKAARGVIEPLDTDANIRSMKTFSFTIAEHDPERPWIVMRLEHRTVELDAGADFFAWVREHWPEPRWSVELDPWQLSPGRQ